MFSKTKTYINFVRADLPSLNKPDIQTLLSGEEARKIYIEEVKDIKDPVQAKEETSTVQYKTKQKRKGAEISLSDKNLFLTVQNNDIDTLKQVLDTSPDKINTVDDFGWSLLMIACQANSVETVKELLKRGIDRTVRDKAGNSAQSLVIKNKNVVLADVLLNYKDNQKIIDVKNKIKRKKIKLKEDYLCEICNGKFSDKHDHLSSTVHNINVSKGRKIPTGYVIPESNKGYQIMLKVGWDEELGLGPDGSGKKYPIKAEQKRDRKGLGHNEKKRPDEVKEKNRKHINKKLVKTDYQNNRRMEINFRREFY